jgi:hypothetical protein
MVSAAAFLRNLQCCQRAESQQEQPRRRESVSGCSRLGRWVSNHSQAYVLATSFSPQGFRIL